MAEWAKEVQKGDANANKDSHVRSIWSACPSCPSRPSPHVYTCRCTGRHSEVCLRPPASASRACESAGMTNYRNPCACVPVPTHAPTQNRMVRAHVYAFDESTCFTSSMAAELKPPALTTRTPRARSVLTIFGTHREYLSSCPVVFAGQFSTAHVSRGGATTYALPRLLTHALLSFPFNHHLLLAPLSSTKAPSLPLWIQVDKRTHTHVCSHTQLPFLATAPGVDLLHRWSANTCSRVQHGEEKRP